MKGVPDDPIFSTNTVFVCRLNAAGYIVQTVQLEHQKAASCLQQHGINPVSYSILY